MKYICIAVGRKNYKIEEKDIKKIYMMPGRKVPTLPYFDEEPCKVVSPATTEAEDYSFSEARDEAFLS